MRISGEFPVNVLYFVDFITIDNVVQPFWIRVQDQAVESYSMREVFNMESSVRIEAIENLGMLVSNFSLFFGQVFVILCKSVQYNINNREWLNEQ